jgi:hypothetical protein
MAKQRANVPAKINPVETGIIPFDNVPDYLKDKAQTGMEGLGKDDFKVPRIKLLQALNPEVRSFQGEAIPGEFWHTGANKSLGSTFNFVPLIVGKRVIVWDANGGDQGGDILAFSKNAMDWTTGGNKTFKVKLKGRKDEVTWQTGRNVATSGLLEWGSSDPEDNNSPPAAQLTYEYLCYLPDHPMLSPCLLGLFRTGLANARQFNTSLFMLRRPTTSIIVKCFADEKSEGKLSWFVPQFKTAGFAPQELFNTCEEIQKNYAEYQAEYNHNDAAQKESLPDDDGKY